MRVTVTALVVAGLVSGQALAGREGAGPRPAGTPPPPAAAIPEPTPEVTPEPTPLPGTIAGKVSLKDRDGVRAGEGAVVYLARVDPELWPEEGRPAQGEARMTMKDKRFEPRVLPVLQDRPVSFPNLDPVFHNVFSLSGKNKFDLGLYKDGKSKTQAFTEPGVVRVFCNIHPAMTAFVLVVQNPWWQVVGANGSFKLSGVPPGSYALKAWHERGGESSREIVVEPGGTARAELELDASRYKVVPHKNKFGRDYSSDGY